MRLFLGPLALCLVVSFVPAAEVPSWPEYLGPDRNAVSPEKGLNLDWKKTPPKTLWKVAGGSGFASLAIVGDRLVTAVQRDQQSGVLCLDAATGKEHWFRPVGPVYLDKQRHGPGPRATPTIVDGVVYALMPTGELTALQLTDGKPLWTAELAKIAALKNRSQEQYYWGQSASPLVEGDLVIVQPGGGENASVMALNRKSGKVVWQLGSDAMGYASPLAITWKQRRVLIVPTGQAILGVDPGTGKQLFRHPFGNRFDATCSTPAWTGELLVVSAAYGVGSSALELIEKDGQVEVREKWKTRDLMSLMAPLIVDGKQLYGFHGDLGRFGLRGLDITTGKLLWMEGFPGRITFVWAEGHLWSITEQGTLQLIAVQEKGAAIRGEIPNLLQAKAWAMPVLLGKRLYLRDEHHILCLDVAGR